MKKFFMFAAMTSVALASCVKNEPAMNLEQGDLIQFNSPVVGIPTKVAEYNAVAYPTDVPFNVTAWYHTAADATTGDVYMNNVTLTYDNGLKVYRAQGTKQYYWPKNGMLTFFAYSPATLPEGGDGALARTAVTNAVNAQLEFTVPTDEEKQVDLLYSDFAKNQKSTTGVKDNENYETTAGVDISFNHALSVIKFNFKGTAAATQAIRMRSVTLEGVDKTGTLTCGNTGTASWNVTTSAQNYVVLEDLGAGVYTKALTELGEQYANLILLPQELEDELLRISYYLQTTDGWLPQEQTLNLTDAKVSSVSLDEWAMNTKYTYNIVIDVDEIYFAPAIDEAWETELTDSWQNKL